MVSQRNVRESAAAAQCVLSAVSSIAPLAVDRLHHSRAARRRARPGRAARRRRRARARAAADRRSRRHPAFRAAAARRPARCACCLPSKRRPDDRPKLPAAPACRRRGRAPGISTRSNVPADMMNGASSLRPISMIWPRPPRWRPAPPESARSSLRQTTTGEIVSVISIGMQRTPLGKARGRHAVLLRAARRCRRPGSTSP